MPRTTTQLMGILAGVLAALLGLRAPAYALTASATLQGTVVKVQGSGVTPGHSVYWEGMWGGFASALGTFAFFSVDVPADCIGDVTADLAKIAVAIAGCMPHTFPATGQTTCWNGFGSVIPCAGTGLDGDIRAGAALSYTDNGDGTITDNNTGLMWEKQSDDGSIHDKDTLYTWADTFAVHIAGLNAGAGFAGHTDWRLPNIKELQSIVNYQNFSPAVSPAFNTSCSSGCTVLTGSCTAADNYWASTIYAPSPFDEWSVNFTIGSVDVSSKGSPLPVRAVRGGR